MTIESRELMQSPRFEGIGSFVYCRPGNEEWKPSYVIEFFGGQMTVEVDESEVHNPPAVGAMFLIAGNLRHNSRNGSVSLVSSVKKPLADSPESLTQAQMEQYVRGLQVSGVGIVHSKDSVSVNRQTYSKATLKWQGATHEFRKLTPELYQRIPAIGKYVRFELGLSVKEEKNLTGQSVLIQFPSLVSIKADELSTGSVPRGSAPPEGSAAPPRAAATPPKA